jgi:hypothetical protein
MIGNIKSKRFKYNSEKHKHVANELKANFLEQWI